MASAGDRIDRDWIDRDWIERQQAVVAAKAPPGARRAPRDGGSRPAVAGCLDRPRPDRSWAGMRCARRSRGRVDARADPAAARGLFHHRSGLPGVHARRVGRSAGARTAARRSPAALSIPGRMVGLPPHLPRRDLGGAAAHRRESAAEPTAARRLCRARALTQGAVLAAVATAVWLYAGFWWSFSLVVALAVGWLTTAMLFFRTIPMD